MLVNASFMYPENTPTTKEAYYYRAIHEKFFPKVWHSSLVRELIFHEFDFFDFWFSEQNAARLTVPGGPSVTCSTAKAVEWDAAWSKKLDPSGRAALGVHEASYEGTQNTNTKTADLMNDSLQTFPEGFVEKTATVV